MKDVTADISLWCTENNITLASFIVAKGCLNIPVATQNFQFQNALTPQDCQDLRE